MDHEPTPETNDLFVLDEPRQIGMNTEFAFWLMTEHENLLDVVAALGCVVGVLDVEDARYLVEISDDHDPDEAWHWVCSEIEAELANVELDPIWEEALKWIL